ncbi:hypothetical protein M153_20200012232 [Pseudoloma neurophilia]|uniref:Uncharacterized protein n=1 Tax=Pseudoloma neurophilia TaxID=146866 RepID=A0A0R0M4Y6_9MICR|nr:hypothetical protein M153_20200012232 [Pseudoloma neurophilia]
MKTGAIKSVKELIAIWEARDAKSTQNVSHSLKNSHKTSDSLQQSSKEVLKSITLVPNGSLSLNKPDSHQKCAIHQYDGKIKEKLENKSNIPKNDSLEIVYCNRFIKKELYTVNSRMNKILKNVRIGYYKFVARLAKSLKENGDAKKHAIYQHIWKSGRFDRGLPLSPRLRGDIGMPMLDVGKKTMLFNDAARHLHGPPIQPS